MSGKNKEPCKKNSNALPILPITGLTREKINLFKRLSIIDGNLLSIFLSAISGFVITGYALYLGFTSFQLSWVFAVLTLSNIVGPVGAWLAGKLGSRKFLAKYSALIARLAFVLLPILIYVEVFSLKLSLFILIMTIYGLLASVNTALWCSWVGAAIPDKERGEFLTRRFAINNVFGSAAIFFSGIVLDNVPAPFNFQITFWVTSFFGLLALIPFSLQSEPKYSLISKSRFKITILKPKFRTFLVFTSIFSIGLYMSGNLVFIYFIRDLHMSYTFNAIWWITISFLDTYFSPLWLKLATRFGVKSILVCVICVSVITFPVLLIAAKNGISELVWIAAFIEGLCAAATNSLAFDLPRRTAAPDEIESLSLGFWAIVGLSGCIGNLAGGFLIDKLSSLRLPDIFGVHLVPFHFVVLLSSAFKLLALIPLLPRKIEPEYKLSNILPHIVPALYEFTAGRVISLKKRAMMVFFRPKIKDIYTNE